MVMLVQGHVCLVLLVQAHHGLGKCWFRVMLGYDDVGSSSFWFRFMLV